MTAMPKKKHLLRKIVVGILIILVILLAGMIGLGSLRAQYTVTYQGYIARAGSLQDEMSFDSTMTLVDSQTVTASAAGKIRRVMKTPGMDVKKDDTILILQNGERIRADVDGRVNTVPFAAGDAYKAGDTLVTVADFTHMKVSFNANEYTIGKLHRGQPCTVRVTSGGQTYTAALDSINYTGVTSRNVANYACTVYVTVGEHVYPGMQAKVTFQETLAEDAVILSRDALSFDADNQAFVYLQDEQGEMVQHPVSLGELNDKNAQILAGLADGEVCYARVKNLTAQELMMQLMRQRQQQMGGGGNRNNRQNYGNR